VTGLETHSRRKNFNTSGLPMLGAHIDIGCKLQGQVYQEEKKRKKKREKKKRKGK
jgi:hypothetical protein